MLAANFLYSLEARPGAPDEGFGFAVAANDQFHVVSNFASNLTYYFLEEQPDFDSFFYGEIQVHDATTGELLRTIQNPFPYGTGRFGGPGAFDDNNEFNFELERPNSFGYSIDIFENLILVGSPGWEGDFDYEFDAGDHDTGGRAFLFDAETGDLLHTFDGSYFPQAPGGQPGQSPGGGNNDGFGRSVSIDGNRIAIGAHGPSYEDVEKTSHDIDPGRVYIYSPTTGDLLHLLESPDPSPVETLDFGATVSLSDGKLVVTEGDQFFTEWQSGYEFGPVRVYDVQTGDLLHTLPVDGFEAVIEGNNIAILEAPGTTHLVNATTGAVTQTIPGRLYDFDGNLIVTGPASGDPTAFPVIRDFPTGIVLYSVPTPPGFVEAYFEYNQIPQLFGDRLFVPGRQGAASEDVVFVYSVTDGPSNSPPTDIALTNNSVPENSANGTVIGTLSATDPDLGDTFTFELINSAGGRFALNGNQVVVADGSKLDFEADSTHPIVVHVTDSAGNVFGETLTIQLTNINDPTDITLSPNSVHENSPNGTVVGTLSATDLDPGETFAFALLTTAGGRFALQGDQIVVANGSALNFEANAFHNVTVQVTDSTGNTYSEVLAILVTNVNEPPTSIGISNNQVLENTLVGAVGVLASNDPDSPDAQTFELLDNAGGRFALVGSIITVANGGLLDFETDTSHTISVQVTDSVGNQFTGQVTINVLNVNESPTDIALSNSSVSESTVRLIHNLTPEPQRSFGGMLAIAGNRLLINDFDISGPQTRPGRVMVMDTATGERIVTLANPNPVSNQLSVDGWFGLDGAISGNLAIVAARIAKVGSNDNAGVVYVFNATTGGLLHTLSSPTPGSSLNFGQAVAASGNVVAVGSLDGVQGAGVVYLYNAVTGALLTTIPNPDPDASVDFFGAALAFSGNTLVVGVPEEILGGLVVGRAYLYHINPISFAATFVSTLSNPTPAAGEFFGSSVAVAGNLVAVSAFDDAGAPSAGAVYVFDATTGSLLRTITEPFPAANNGLGNSLAIKDQYVIASSRAKNSSTGGVAYVFHATSGELVATISNPSPESLDSFGGQIVVDGSRLVISDPGDDTDSQNHGMVYVYELPFGQAFGTLSTTDPDVGDTFTYALTNNADGRFAIDGNQLVIADATKLDFEAVTSHVVTVDVVDAAGNFFSKDFNITVTQVNEAPQDVILTGNTVPEAQVRYLHNIGLQAIPTFGYVTATDGDLVVAGHNNLPSHNLPGEVSVYNKTTGELVAVLAAPSPQLGELFGETIAISGNKVVVGARLRNTGVGVAYVFDATTGALLHTLNNPTPASSGTFPDNFGSAVAISGSLIAIGSEEDLGAPDSGAVYLFDATTGSLVQTIASPNPAIQSKFGNSLSLIANTLVVGASLANRAYIFEFNPTPQSASLVATLNVPPGGGVDSFGRAVTIVGNIVAVGAPNNDTAAANSGQVHLFDRTTGNFLSTLNNPSPDANDNFGSYLAGNETYLAVAAQFDDTDVADSGRVYIFDPSNGQLISSIANPTPNGGDFFSRVSFSGNTLVVGAPTDDADGANAGMVYVFDLPLTNTVGSLSTTDPDAGDLPIYTLVNDAEGRFGLVGNQIVVVDPWRLNFEVAASHSLLIQSTDSSGQSTFEAFVTQVSNANEPPQNVAFTGDGVNENALNGTVVSSLSATDPDAASSTTYSLVNNAGGRFEIAGDAIIVANSGLLDFETSTSHTVIVRATDSGGKFVLETRRINVIDILEATDFGDLPDSFGTNLATDGARHMLSNTLRLGAAVTSELNGQPSGGASLDLADDGVSLPAFFVPGLNATFTVTASQVGRLDAFVDYDGNGEFAETERITPAAGQLLIAGANSLTVAVPPSAVAGNRGVRFRLSTAGGLGPIGQALDGEVEDYIVNTLIPSVNSGQLLPHPEFPGQTMFFVRGTVANDKIAVSESPSGMRVTINGVTGPEVALPSRVVIFGLHGDDDIRLNGTLLPGHIDGGTGNDTIRGGSGPDLIRGGSGEDILYGRAGEDVLYGGSGNDALFSNGGVGYLFGEGGHDVLWGNGVLVGGTGADTLNANGGRNLLIGGVGGDAISGANANQGDIVVASSTIYDIDLVNLRLLRNEWRAGTSYQVRIANLSGTGSGGLNGNAILDATTIFTDSSVDDIVNFGTNNPRRTDWVLMQQNDNKLNSPGVVTIIGGVASQASGEESTQFLVPLSETGFHNFGNPGDVNDDTFVTALDALIVISQLDELEGVMLESTSHQPPFIDVNQDGKATAMDALLVINQLNQLAEYPLLIASDVSDPFDVAESESMAATALNDFLDEERASDDSKWDQLADLFLTSRLF